MATPHAPLGVDASFDFGPPEASVGFTLPGGIRSPQDIYLGCRAGPADAWSLLPFYAPGEDVPLPLAKGRFGRFLALAGDKWMIGPLVFKLCTPFATEDQVADEAFRYAPVVCGYLEYDNSHSDHAAELLFGFRGQLQALDARAQKTGFQFAATHGWATSETSDVMLIRDSALFGFAREPAAALHFRVPPHSKRLFPLVLGFFAPGFFYTRFFTDLASVLDYGLENHARYLALSDARDAEFMRSPLGFEAKAKLAHDVRTWLAGTRRLAREPEIDLGPLRALCRVL